MKTHMKGGLLCSVVFINTLLSFSIPAFASESDIQKPSVAHQVFNSVKHNNNWKISFLTAKGAQVVFMSITPTTNPKNEIGMETHKFDQIIFVVEGNGKAILNGEQTIVKPGDMIFIPEGVKHNVININRDKPLKILSVYSSNDMPKNTTYQKKTDESKEE